MLEPLTNGRAPVTEPPSSRYQIVKTLLPLELGIPVVAAGVQDTAKKLVSPVLLNSE
jgi:hypothetical protein